MAKSRSKRSAYTAPAPARRAPSPRWVPWLGLGLIVLGVLVILANYVVDLPGGNWNLVAGFAFMAGGLLVLSQWR